MPRYDLASMSDSQLLLIFKEGDGKAYEQIYNRYWALIYVYACKVLADQDDAQDVVQEVFTSLWRKRADLVITTSLNVYLYTAVRYRIFDYLDHKKVRTNYKEYLQQFIEEGEYITDDQLRERELAAVIEKEVARLPDKMRQIFEMSRNANLSHKEIAEELGLSDQTVKKQVGNALKILKDKLRSFNSFIMINF